MSAGSQAEAPHAKPDRALSVEIVDTGEGMQGLLADWNRVLADSGTDHVYLTHEWLSTWWRHFGHQRELFVVVVRDADGLVAIAPLMIARRRRWHGLTGRHLQFIGYPQADRMDIIVARRREEAVRTTLDHCLARCERWDVCELSELDSESPNLPLLSEWCRSHRHLLLRRVCSGPPFLRLDDMPPRGKLDKKLRYLRRRLEREHAATFRRLRCSPEEIRRELPRIKALAAKSWKARAGLGFFSDPALTAFYEDMSVTLAEREWLDLALLEVDSQLVSYRLGFRYARRFWDYDVGYDPDYHVHSPGMLLMDFVVGGSRELGLDAVDASRGIIDEHILRRWTQERHLHHELTFFHRGLRSRFLGLLERYLKPFLKRLLQRRHDVCVLSP